MGSIGPLDITGEKYGYLTAIKLSHTKVTMSKSRPGHKNRVRYWKCDCDCGNKAVVNQDKLRSGHTKSCGCYHIKRATEAATVHGGSGTKEFRAWCNIIKRCMDPSGKDYSHYGGRGIKICDKWMESFESFLSDVGKSPSPKHTIDRIDNSGNYEPGNVRWATRLDQARNTRRVKLSLKKAEAIRKRDKAGENRKELAKEFGVSIHTIRAVVLKKVWN